MKRIINVLLVVMMLVGITACGKENFDSSTSSTTRESSVSGIELPADKFD